MAAHSIGFPIKQSLTQSSIAWNTETFSVIHAESEANLELALDINEKVWLGVWEFQ